ncbi:hypothetical protein [Burkholderia pyrrocinia]|uniref:hypothetical protein n=1 Tax=Burkholderia pyrrocinia TaxID=60550 RepID=UPI00158A3BF7|nr:hypothetical protein [Burkholderia pyrrocinia]
MRKRSVCILYALFTSGAFACSPVRTLDISFERNSAKIPGNELVKLANWAIDLQLKYPNLAHTSIGGLAEATEKEPRVLAEQRAENVRQILSTLGFGRAPIDIDAGLYKPPHIDGMTEDGRRVEIDFLPGCPHECPCQVK